MKMVDFLVSYEKGYKAFISKVVRCAFRAVLLPLLFVGCQQVFASDTEIVKELKMLSVKIDAAMYANARTYANLFYPHSKMFVDEFNYGKQFVSAYNSAVKYSGRATLSRVIGTLAELPFSVVDQSSKKYKTFFKKILRKVSSGVIT